MQSTQLDVDLEAIRKLRSWWDSATSDEQRLRRHSESGQTRNYYTDPQAQITQNQSWLTGLRVQIITMYKRVISPDLPQDYQIWKLITAIEGQLKAEKLLIEAVASAQLAEAKYFLGEIIIVTKPGTDYTEFSKTIHALNLKITNRSQSELGDRIRIEVPVGSEQQWQAHFKALPEVKYSELAHIYKTN